MNAASRTLQLAEQFSKILSDLAEGGYSIDEMQFKSDAQLLSEYAIQGTERAFAEIVARHTSLVYSAALRQVNSPTLAADVTQGVFINLARNAANLSPKLNVNASLAGWLCRSARNLALNALRDEYRRISRERQAVQTMKTNSDSAPDWTLLRPELDSAMSELSEADYDALVLRYFKNQGLREVGRALGVSDDTAQKRVARALEKLHGLLSKRGITSSVTTLSVLLAAHAVQAAPIGLTEAISRAAALAGKASAASQAATTIKFITMTTTQKTLIALGLLSFLGVATYNGFRNVAPKGEPPQARQRDTLPTSARGQTGKKVILPPAEANRLTSTVRETKMQLAADLRAAIRDVPASRLGTRSYPPENVMRALLAFGSDRKDAFAIVREALDDADVEIQKRAISTLGHIGVTSTPQLAEIGIVGEPAPEAKPLLWKILQENNRDFASLALSSLQMIGFEANEIPALANLMAQTDDAQLRRYLPEALARTIQRDAAAALPFLSDVEALLDHSNPTLQFAAACALAQHEATTNSKILATLTSGLENSSVTEQLMAMETLQRLGPVAEPALQALLDFGDTTKDQVLKDVAFKTIGKINSATRVTLPEVDHSLNHEERLSRFQEQFASGNYNRLDLIDALKEPMFAPIAAEKLAEQGPVAKDALPNLISALSGKDQGARERIVQAIRQIDPETPILKVDSSTIAAAATAASLAHVDSIPNAGLTQNSLENLLEKSRMMNSEWQTHQELINLAKAIAAESLEAYQTFAAKVVELEPALADLLQMK